MATAVEIQIIRLNINDESYEDFTDDTYINYYFDMKDSIPYACWKLIDILIVRLRKEILKRDVSGAESTEFVSLKERIELLELMSKKYEDEYNSDNGTSTGLYIASVKPTIAGGDI